MTPIQKRLFALGLGLVAVACLGWCVWRAQSLSGWVRAEATVVRVDAVRGTTAHAATHRVPVAAFELDGSAVEYPLLGSANSPNCCDEGEVVPVLYPPDRPEQVMVGRVSELYGPALLFAGVLTLFALLIGLVA